MAYGLTQSLDLGTTEVAYVADNSLLEISNTFTLETWINFNSISTLNVFMGKWKTAGNNRSFGFRLYDDAGTKYLQIYTDSDGVAGGASVKTSSAVSISAGTWYHVAVASNAGSGTFYLDGVSAGTFTGLSAAADKTGEFVLGAERTDGTDGADCKMSLVRLWQTSRSGTDIADNMCNVLGATTNLSGEWTLDNTLADNSGNSLDFTTNTGSFVSDVPAVCGGGGAAFRNNLLIGSGL